MYMSVFEYIHVYYKKGIYTVNTLSFKFFHSHTGKVAEFTSPDQIEGSACKLCV